MKQDKINNMVLLVIIFVFGIFSFYLTHLCSNLEKTNAELVKKEEINIHEIEELNKKLEQTMEENIQLQEELSLLKEDIDKLKSEKETKVSVKSVDKSVSKVAYLTFDDGPSKNTEKILDALKLNGIKATFFINGNYNKELVKRILEDGHTVGNHTYSHDYKTIYSSEDAFFADFDKLNKKLEEDFGYKTNIMRFPGGSNNTVSHKYGGNNIMDVLTKSVKNKNYVYFDWNVSSQDATGQPITKEQIVQNVLNGSKDKNTPIILMHDAATKTSTAEAVPDIISGLKEMGYEFDKLSESSPVVAFK